MVTKSARQNIQWDVVYAAHEIFWHLKQPNSDSCDDSQNRLGKRSIRTLNRIV